MSKILKRGAIRLNGPVHRRSGENKRIYTTAEAVPLGDNYAVFFNSKITFVRRK